LTTIDLTKKKSKHTGGEMHPKSLW